MNIMRLVALTLIITVTGCADLQRQAEDYDTSVLARLLSVCDGEMWFSNEVDEKLCVRRSNWHQNTFLLTQDAAEYWTDFFATYTSELGILYSHLDDDTTEKWFQAADQYMRKNYGAKAEIVEFKKVQDPMGFVFRVKPGDQIPPWEETEVPEFILASQMVTPAWQEPGKYAYAATGYMIEVPVHRRSGRPRKLMAMVKKAVKSSLRPGQVNTQVQTEVLDPRHLAGLTGAPSATQAAAN
jgi:hypothetical protein